MDIFKFVCVCMYVCVCVWFACVVCVCVNIKLYVKNGQVTIKNT